jgi:hypothetical protein
MDKSLPFRMTILRSDLANRELEKSRLLVAIASPSITLARKQKAINRYVDLAAETSEIISELQLLQNGGGGEAARPLPEAH